MGTKQTTKQKQAIKINVAVIFLLSFLPFAHMCCMAVQGER